MISALLEQGEFNPERYNVTDEDIEGWDKLWRFCVDHQKLARRAPPLALVAKKYPDFEHSKDIDPVWAAAQVLDASNSRKMRLAMYEASMALKEGALGDAYAHLDAIPRPRTHVREASSVFDHALIEDGFDVSKIEVPYRSLMDVTGGIGPGELWFYGARWSQGKSWLLCKQAVVAAKAGYNTVILSYEMPSVKVARRMHRIFAENDRGLYRKIRSLEPLAYKEAVDIIADRTPGTVRILDSGYGDVMSVNFVAQVATECDLVIVDHVGLMKDAAGHRAGEDWRYHMSISNVLKEITMESGTPILGAIQVNREGERSGAMTPPRGSNAAGTDALGQDADVLVMHKRMSERVMVHGTEKVREGAKVRFFSSFDVERNRWGEISREEALEIALQDGEVNED